MAPLPAGEPDVPHAGDGRGQGPPHGPLAPLSRLIQRRRGLLLALAAAFLALRVADWGEVTGPSAVPDAARAGVAILALLLITGFGLTRLLLPESQRRWELFWIPAVGACATALAMTVLGFAAVPFKANLAIVLAAGAVVGVIALRRRPPARPQREAVRELGWPVYLALLLVLVALVPMFRSGFATVIGSGQDAHLAVGSAEFLQHHYPTETDPNAPIDKVPLVWRSKQPIYYALGSGATLSGLEPYQTIAVMAATMLALASLGFFLLARSTLGAGLTGAVCAMVAVGLDRMVLHTAMHPYFNQIWGFFTLPFTLVLAWLLATRRAGRGGAVLLAMFLAVGGFAYPLMLPIPLLALGIFWWKEGRIGELDPRRVYHGRRSLAWMIPVGLVLLVPLRGVIEKSLDAARVVFSPTFSLDAWGGDLDGYFEENWFFGVQDWEAFIVLGPIIAAFAIAELRRQRRPLALGLGAVFAFAVVFAAYFRTRDVGYYFHFKTLAFIAPVILAVAVVSMSRLRRWAPLVLAIAILTVHSTALREMHVTFDQLPKTVIGLRELAAATPADASIRLDMPSRMQTWGSYMLASRRLCSERPLTGTSYPHVPRSRKADFAVVRRGFARSPDLVGGPLRSNREFALYRLRPDTPGPERCSKRMVQTVTETGAFGS